MGYILSIVFHLFYLSTPISLTVRLWPLRLRGRPRQWSTLVCRRTSRPLHSTLPLSHGRI